MISIVIPTLNEELNIGRVLDTIKKAMANRAYEILVIDNSTDSTPTIAKSKGAKVIREKRKGYGRAYKTGFFHVTGEIIVTLDGDGTYPAHEIPALVDILEEQNFDFISCDRLSMLEDETQMSKTHRIGNAILNFMMLCLYFYKIRDSQSGMWIFRRTLLNKMHLRADGMAFSEEIKIEAIKHGKFTEVPIVYGARVDEKKLNTFRDGVRNLLFLILKRFLN